METKRIRKTTALFTVCILSFAGMALAGEEGTAPPKCSHHRACCTAVVARHSLFYRLTHGNYVAVASPTYQTGMDFNNPVVGPPLYYQGDNLNWEEAPPFGLWN